jgi:hypothetical protein
MGLNWIYNGSTFTEDMIADYIGFVYIITNNVSNRKYIGKKIFHFTRTKQINGKKKKVKIPSDWQSYYGSNDELNKDVKSLGKSNFTREILYLCSSKGECSYLEAKMQFNYNVLESDDFYNTWVMCRVRKSHIKEYNARIS